MPRSIRTVRSLAAPLAAYAAAFAMAACETKQACKTNGDGTITAELAFPTGDRSTSAVLVRQCSPGEVQVGREAEYVIEVENLTRGDLQNVSVNLENMSNMRYVSANPAPVEGPNGHVSWILPELPAREMRTIRLRAVPTGAGTASSCLTASYANMLCASTSVVSPALSLEKEASPGACTACDDISLTYVVRNSGTGTAQDVVVRDTLPAGLRTADGRTAIELKAGDLESGKEKRFTVAAKAERSGTYASAASASSATGATATSDMAETVVRQPALAFSCDANNRVFVGRDLDYRLTVRNVGQCDAADTVLKAAIPNGARFVSADGNGKLEGSNVVWDLSTLPAGRAQTVRMNIRPSGIGAAKVRASAAAQCVSTVNTECSTEVSGVPAILLEVIDMVDPIEVGQDVTFSVVVTNQGSSQDSNVKVAATLPPSLQFVSGTGATAVSGSGQTVTIAPIATLAPGARVEWKVVAKAKSAADARSRWELSSDQFRSAISETESTTLYQQQ